MKTKKLYKVTHIDPNSDDEATHYVLTENIQQLEDTHTDIIKIEPLTPLVDLTDDEQL